MDSILQWNLQGMSSSKEDILKLVHDNTPSILAFQETFYGNNFMAKIPNFHGLCKQGHFNQRYHGGVALYIHSSCPYQAITIQSPLQVVAARVQLHGYPVITIASIYIPGRTHVNLAELLNIAAQLPRPFFLLGDFNGHNPLWGGTNTDVRGRLLESLLTRKQLVCLNDRRPTHQSGSSIDLSLCTPELASDRLECVTFRPQQ